MMTSLLVILLAGIVGSGLLFLVQRALQKRARAQALARIGGLNPTNRDKTDKGHETDTARKKQQTITQQLKKAHEAQRAERDLETLSARLMQAGLSTTPARYWLYSALFATLTLVCLWPTDLARPVVLLLTLTSLFGCPRLYLRLKAGKRQKLFLQEFADALEAMIRLLRSGMPIAEAIAMVGREYRGPVGEEMTRVYLSQKMGLPMADAVRKMVPRMPLPEVQMFATAIAIQAQTGSSLAEVLGNLAGVIRARYRLKRKVQALSAEAKISAMIIGALPVVVALSLWGVNPDYIALLFTHGTGKVLLSGAIIWMMFGVLIMKQMINFKV